jgi:antitoxin ParD1/3/4
MPAQHTLHIALTEPMARYVTDQVATGRYATASEVLRAALRLLIERDQGERRPPALLDQAAGQLTLGRP